MSASRTAIFLEFAILVVEVWRNGKNDGAATPADLGWIVCARAHAIPSFTQRARDSPGDGVRRRKSETDFQNRFSEEGHVGFHARRARGKEKIMHACKRTCQALVSRHSKTQSHAGDCAAYESYVYRAFCG